MITWNIHRGAQPETEVEIIPPDGYDEWIPQAAETEKEYGNYITVKIVAHKKGALDRDPPKRVLKYRVDLDGTSREKGG